MVSKNPGKSISYEEFDKLLNSPEQIIEALKEKPLSRKELEDKTKRSKTGLRYILNPLIKKGIIAKRRKGRFYYYGLTNEHRNIQAYPLGAKLFIYQCR